MKAFVVFRKALRETRRDRLIVILTLAFAPFFVFLEWMAFPALTPSYRLALADADRGAMLADGSHLAAGHLLAEGIGAMKDGSGRAVIEVIQIADEAEGRSLLDRREATALVVVPPDFSAALADARDVGGTSPVQVTARLVLVGDLTSPAYAVTAVVAGAALESTVREVSGQLSPIEVVEMPLGGSASRTDFEVYVPGLLVFAVILLVFLAAMTVSRDIEAGTLRRLQLTRMTSCDYLLGTSAVLLLVALAGVAATFGVALALGFHSQGPLWVAALVDAICALSVIGVGLIVAAFSRSVAQAFVIANFPLGLLMFFSGAMFPMPHPALVTIFGHPVGPFDLVPPTHAVAALNKVLTLGADLGDVAFEIGALGVLTVVYFSIGVVLLGRVASRRG